LSARLINHQRPLRFDPSVQVELEEFTDVVGRHFGSRGKGSASSRAPVAHM